MASTSASASGASADVVELANSLYNLLAPLQLETPSTVFHQQDIFDLDVIPRNAQGEDDLLMAMRVLQRLTDEKLLKLVHDPAMGWKVRSRDEASKWRGLSSEEEMVYAYIDDAGDEGAWTKNLKQRTGLHEAVIQAAVKKLKNKNLISDMKSVEHPTRKMFIKSNLSPSERATGGAWYTDGELDEALIAYVSDILFKYIFSKTFYYSKSYDGSYITRAPKKVVKKLSPEEAKHKRNLVLDKAKFGETTDRKQERLEELEKYLPMPAGYQGYATIDDMTIFIDKVKVVNGTLTASELQQLLDVMVFDNQIETVSGGVHGTTYRAVRKAMISDDDRGSVLMEAPCGRCPVFELCEEGGPVGPSNCEYYNEWLTM